MLANLKLLRFAHHRGFAIRRVGTIARKPRESRVAAATFANNFAWGVSVLATRISLRSDPPAQLGGDCAPAEMRNLSMGFNDL